MDPLTLAIARNLAVDHNVGVGVISLEMSCGQLAQRLLSAQTRLDLHRLRAGRLMEEEWVHLHRNVAHLAQAPIYLDEAAGITVLEARARARRLRRRLRRQELHNSKGAPFARLVALPGNWVPVTERSPKR